MQLQDIVVIFSNFVKRPVVPELDIDITSAAALTELWCLNAFLCDKHHRDASLE